MKSIWSNISGVSRNKALLAFVKEGGEISKLWRVRAPQEIDKSGEYVTSSLHALPTVASLAGSVNQNRNPDLAWVIDPYAVIENLQMYGMAVESNLRTLNTHVPHNDNQGKEARFSTTLTCQGKDMYVQITLTERAAPQQSITLEYLLTPVTMTTAQWVAEQKASLQKILDHAAEYEIHTFIAKQSGRTRPQDWLSPEGRLFAKTLGMAL